MRPKRNYPLAMLLLPKNFSTFPWALTIPAIQIGLEKVKKMKDINPIIKDIVLLEPIDSDCLETSKPLYECVVNFVKKMPDVIFGPICDYVIAPIARLMAFWNRPVITSGAMFYAFSSDKKTEFKTLTRIGTGHLDYSTGYLISEIFLKYKWTKARYLFFKEAHSSVIPVYCHGLGIYLIKEAAKKIKNWPIKSYYEIQPSDIKNDTTINNMLIEQIGNKNAIIILCADPDLVRRIMLRAADLNFSSEEYLFLNIDLFSSHEIMERPWYKKEDTKEQNEKAKKAFGNLMTITLKKPDGEKYKEFSKEVKRRAKRDYNFDYKNELVSNFVSSFHEAVVLYALALNDTLNEGGMIDDGALVVKNMWNRSFQGIDTTITISPTGDRYADFSLMDLNRKSGHFEMVANFIGRNRQYQPVENKVIDWGTINNKVPSDTLHCGYDLSGCPKPGYNIGAISAGVMGAFIAIAIIGGIFIHRRTKLQAELNAMNWIIPWDDLETSEKRRRKFSDCDNVNSYGKKRLLNSMKADENESVSLTNDDELKIEAVENYYLMSDMQFMKKKKDKSNKFRRFNSNKDDESNISNKSLDTIVGINLDNMHKAQLFAKTALYKGNLVALKPILTNGKIEINTELLIEIKKVKDMSNDHICRFIGVCVDHPYIIYEYCPKGSLEDVLAKEQLKLDWMFKYSLMQDICRGMIYLHNNHGQHGNLKSSNCLVDSRFVLKITDFGLPSLQGNKTALLQEEPNIYYKNLLWTAPELLRLSNPPVNGTIKGDVYSFAIICQEIVYRNGVFSLHPDPNLSTQDIVEKVRIKCNSPFRPTLLLTDGCTDDVLRLIQQAWDEDPNNRPEFATIKLLMRKLNKSGDTGNILDNLLSRMEQYANNLEGLVTKRTEQYLEEKQKAEDLLYSMLPKFVAHQLINNQNVVAESYDMVTIFFSDIVGFTSLSAESTPIQIIELLNRLYTTFDSIIENYDVYKVETIGDAYMVCSGLPQLNGNLHSREIARMSIAFLNAISVFIIPHRPDKKLELRVGIHSGPVCSGVVGLKMPRYCLFGDTVNTSSRMESNGLPLKIHISNSTKEILDTFGTFVITERGYIDLKGKGLQLTYWLHGEDSNIVDPLPLK